MTDNGSNWPPASAIPGCSSLPVRWSRRRRCTTTPAPVIRGPPIRSAPGTRRGAGPSGIPAPRAPGGSPRHPSPPGGSPRHPSRAGWQPATPAPAGHGAGPGPGEYRGGDPEPYRQPDEGDYDTGDRFVPGFGDYAEEDYHAEPPRRGRAARGRSAPPPGPPRRPRRRRFRWIAPLAALAVILIPIAIGGAYAYSFYMSKYHPADYSGAGTGRVVVQVPSGATPTSLAPELTKLGVVASARAFVLAAEHSSNQDALLPGFYGVHLHMQATQAYALLVNPKNLVQVTVTIPEGWRLSQIVAVPRRQVRHPGRQLPDGPQGPGQAEPAQLTPAGRPRATCSPPRTRCSPTRPRSACWPEWSSGSTRRRRRSTCPRPPRRST